MEINKPEVLAPVGNFESLSAAVRSGADAVYFGCKEFSARRNAVNFSFEEMRDAVKYCKKYGVKTYLTLNIAIKDNELESALKSAKEAYLAGVDGLIVSDLGLASLIKKSFPDIELHASTQCSVNSPSALKFLKEIGFCRVVPAREMSKEELVSLCNEAKKQEMEVEVFVHGALCMSLSGQCLMSAVLGGRSGNRGLCAGPCRLPFSVLGGTGYDLSLKDLSLFSYVDELKKMGVTSLKIEGRMKRPEYIAATVSACRSAVDVGFVPEDLQKVLKGVFSRSGFTDGYYTKKLGREMFGTRSKDDVEKSKETFAFLHNLYRNERSKIPVIISAEIKDNLPIRLEMKSYEKIVTVSGEIPQKAKNIPLSKETAELSFSKLGGTPFFVTEINVDLGENLFVSNKELNEIRRKGVELLENEYLKIPDRKTNEILINSQDKEHNKTPKLYAEFLDIDEIPDDLSDIDLAIIPLEKVEEKLPKDIKIAVDIPKFTTDEESIKNKLERAKSKGINTAVCETICAFNIAKEMGFEIIGGIGLNVLNEQTAKVFADMGIDKITLSAEILIKRANAFKTVADKGIFAYGRLPLMCFRNCPIKNGNGCSKCDKKGYITDRTNTDFPIRCRENCSVLFNSKPIYLADRLNDIKNTDYLILSFTTEEKCEIGKIIKDYKNQNGSISDYTRGMYFKDVL